MGRMDQTLTSVGIIGFGRIGAAHAEWLGALPDVRIAGVYDPTPARRALAEQHGLAAVDDLRRILEDERVDAVLVATPTSMHFEHATAALAAGKHVMVEKPVTLNAEQCRALISQAERSGRVLSVFHNRRWDLDYLTLKRAIEAGLLGRLINVESRLHQWASCVGPAAREWRPNWRNEAAFGGGGLYDWGSHFVDQIIRLVPARPLRVFAQLRGNVWSTDCDDFARVLIDFEGGIVGMVEINTTTTHPGPRWHVDGTRGSAESATNLDFDVYAWAKLLFTPGTALPDARQMSQMLPLASSDVLDERAIWKRFVAACRGDGQPAVTAQSVLPTMQMLDAARQSSQEGRTIDVWHVMPSSDAGAA